MFGFLFCVIFFLEFDGEVGGYGTFGDNWSEVGDFVSIFVVYCLSRELISHVQIETNSHGRIAAGLFYGSIEGKGKLISGAGPYLTLRSVI